MDWNLQEAIAYYKRMGAPADQNAVIQLLREIQQEHGGSVPKSLLPQISEQLGAKEALLTAIIRRIPSLRLSDSHTLEMCAGPNCGKAAALAAFAEKACAGKAVNLKFVGCMRLCGKGPNLRFDGQVYHKADEALIDQVLKDL